MSASKKEVINWALKNSKPFGTEKEEITIERQKSGRLIVKFGVKVLGYLEDGKFTHGMASQLLSIEMLRDIANKMEEAANANNTK